MSTEIKNTLFRFVTMRAPELSEEKHIGRRFVFYSPRLNIEDIREFEDAVISNEEFFTKWECMVNFAPIFTPLTVAEIKEVNPSLYEFGVWLSRNRYSASREDMVAQLTSLEPLVLDQLNFVWDNLFYHVVTKDNFYGKEANMQLLCANHFLENYVIGLSDDEVKQLAYAKVVLPKRMFVEDDDTSYGSVAKLAIKDIEDKYKAAPSAQDTKMRIQYENQTKKSTIENNLKLKKELLNAEKKYRKEYQEAFKTAYDTNLEAARASLVLYNSDVEDARLAWCELNVAYDENDPCKQPPKVPKPDVTPLDFTFRNEMDLEYLQEQLSEDSFDLLVKTFDINVDEELSGDGYSYSQTYEVLDGVINQNSQVIINNTPSQSTTVVSVGGVVVPTTQYATLPSFSYQVCPKPIEDEMVFYITIEVPDASWEVYEGGSSHVITGSSVASNGLTFVSRYQNSIMLITNEKYPVSETITVTEFEATIKFTNGVTKEFTIPSSASASIFRSCFSGLAMDDVGGPIIDPTPANFIPSGFGFKQIGIADYRRVEQTVHGYIEGDVAHIENVMAREYKEKATRKLRKSENTTTFTSESEKEKLSDTTTTDRFEMQSEVAKVIQESIDIGANAYASYSGGGTGNSYTIGGNVNMASHSSNEESLRQAVTQAKEVTERAMERIVTKVKEERIEKIIEEFEENNKHGFDNTKGDKHVVGVYRWIDKVYKNQIYNYGKRLMFEFMIPEPSKLHLLGMTEVNMGTTLVEPVDPRKYIDAVGTPFNDRLNLADFSCVNDKTVKYWGGQFNVDFESAQESTIYISHSFSDETIGIDDGGVGRWSGAYSNDDFKIPENYEATYVSGMINSGQGTFLGGYVSPSTRFIICGSITPDIVAMSLNRVREKITISATFWDTKVVAGSLVAKCELTAEARKKWQQETFMAIMEAYEDALADYKQRLAEEQELGVKIKGENPGFYRQIENMILRKNCISYLINQDPNAVRTYGRNMFKPLNNSITRNFGNHEVNVSADLDDYTAFARFIEQSFEWEIMSYNFYPYYWGDRQDWTQMYQYDNNDPLFRNFMQAGMARVIVTVRPGFEEAVRFYMQTGEIWNGGEVPVIEDPLFLSIVDELRAPVGLKEGKAWSTRLPTSLTILQADSIGLQVDRALPGIEDDLADFENPDEVPVSTDLLPSETTMQGSIAPQVGKLIGKITGNENIQAKIVLKNSEDELRDLTYCDEDGNWELTSVPPGIYTLLLDANDDFNDAEFEVIDGEKSQIIELAANQTMEVNLTVNQLP